MDAGLRRIVLSRLDADEVRDAPWAPLVFAALAGRPQLEEQLQGDAAGAKPDKGTPTHAAAGGAFLRSITVEGFRGIGPRQTLEVTPGPGLTLVVGRNGSGKSSFAEALEVLLTGDSMRWKERAAVWRDGWRNLHQPTALVQGVFVIEGAAAPCVVARRWEDGAEFSANVAAVAVELNGSGVSDLDSLGWTSALRTHRPFLSYNELGSLLDEGPSKLYDALSAILGLEELVQAQGAFQDARREREKALKDVMDARVPLLEALRAVNDDRARRVVGAIEGKEWDLAAVGDILAGAPATGGGTAPTDTFLMIASLEPPDPAHVATAVAEMRAAAADLKAAARTEAARSRDAAQILELALAFHAAHGDGDCPVCGEKKALDRAWAKKQQGSVGKLRGAAVVADAAHERAASARRLWEGLVVLKPEPLQRAIEIGFDLTAFVAALGVWNEGAAITDLERLAKHVEQAREPLADALVKLRDEARKELGRREDAWRPVALLVSGWLAQAVDATRGKADLDRLKPAETWLKKAAAGIRDDRFGPIADRAAGHWAHLRQQSHVELGRIQLTGDGTRRRVVLDVTVDGVPGAALGVMSQGELHSLALSLFVPRATLPESPFRFIVIDDPVQSMDPARVDGLARVLESASADRQVLVFTHDDRLPEAVRRLDIAADIIEVTRRDRSLVETRRCLDPVGRYLEDALAVAGTAELPATAAAEVVPGLCRLALEAACMEVVRRRRLSRGEAHAEVERSLSDAGELRRLAALALFDDAERGQDVLQHVRDGTSAQHAVAYERCEAEADVDIPAGQALELVRLTSKLAAWLRGTA